MSISRGNHCAKQGDLQRALGHAVVPGSPEHASVSPLVLAGNSALQAQLFSLLQTLVEAKGGHALGVSSERGVPISPAADRNPPWMCRDGLAHMTRMKTTCVTDEDTEAQEGETV